MPGPARVDQTIWQGDDTPPLVWGFGPEGAPEIPAGGNFRLEIAWIERLIWPGSVNSDPGSGEITATSPNGGLMVDYDAGTVSWPYSTDQSASIPRLAVVGYVLRCLYGGKTQVWAEGRVFAKSGKPLGVGA